MGKADISGKKTINIYNRAWAEWVLQRQQIEVEAEIVKQILRWEMTIVKESPIIQELLTQERQLGFAE